MASVGKVVFFLIAIFVSMEPQITIALDNNIQRNIDMLDFEMKMLKDTLTKKHAALSKLRGCVGTLKSFFYNGTNLRESSIGMDPFIKTVKAVRKITEFEKYLYSSIMEKMRMLYPSSIPLDSSKTSRENLIFLDKVLGVMKEQEVKTAESERCDVASFKGSSYSRPVFIRRVNTCSRFPDRCYITDFTVLPDGSLIWVEWARRTIKRVTQTGSRIFRRKLDFRPSSVTYYKENKVLVESVPRRERMFYAYDLKTGNKTEEFSIHRGDVSYNSVVTNGIVFIGGKYGGGMRVYNGYRQRGITRFITNRDQYHSLIPFNIENESPYILLHGSISQTPALLIKPSGERLCKLHDDARAVVVRKNGDIMYVFNTINNDVVIKRYTKECNYAGYYKLDIKTPVLDAALINNTLFIASTSGFHLFSI